MFVMSFVLEEIRFFCDPKLLRGDDDNILHSCYFNIFKKFSKHCKTAKHDQRL